MENFNGDRYITIENHNIYESTWRMTIDLVTLSTLAGRRVPDPDIYGRYIVDYPLPRARKLIKLILEYGTDEDFRKCEDAFKINARLYKIWDKMSGSEWKTAEPVDDIPF